MSEHSLRADEWISLAMERYLDMVYRLAYARTGNRQDAEDISQDVMMKLMKHAGTIESETHLKAWLIRVTVNQSNNLFRNAWHRLISPLEDWMPGVEDEKPDCDILDEALDKLTPNLRTVVHLFYYEEMSMEEIANGLGIRPETVKVRLSRARKALKKHLTNGGGRENV